MEGEVLNVVGEAHYADDQLRQRMHQECQITDLCIRQGEYPKLQAVVELPTVDVLQRILRQAIANRAQMQAQLPNVLEAHLVPN